MKQTLKLSIILVNYNTQSLLEDCLRSLTYLNLSTDQYEVLIVDNASENFDSKRVKGLFVNGEIILSKKNIGFGKACNLAAAKASGQYLWLLNTDTIVPKNNQLEKLVEFLDTNPKKYAATLPLILDSEGKPQNGQIGYLPSLWRMVLAKIVEKRTESSKLYKYGWLNADWQKVEEKDVQKATAAALMVRRSMFEAVGGFRKDYFMYYEDDDLCAKFRANHYKIRFLPSSTITHLEGASSKDNVEKKRIARESQATYFRIWKSSLQQWGLSALQRRNKKIGKK